MEFKSYITEQKNTHMTHIEDKVLNVGHMCILLFC